MPKFIQIYTVVCKKTINLIAFLKISWHLKKSLLINLISYDPKKLKTVRYFRSEMYIYN